MNLQMIDHLEKILSVDESLERDKLWLRQAGLTDESGTANDGIINLLVGRFSTPLADTMTNAGIPITEVTNYFQTLLESERINEAYLLTLFLFESLDFPIPKYFMLLPACPAVLKCYLTELLADLLDISTDQ